MDETEKQLTDVTRSSSVEVEVTTSSNMGDKCDVIGIQVVRSKLQTKRVDRDLSTHVKPSGLYYDIQDNPPIHLAILFGFQISMANIFNCVNIAVVMAQVICADQQFAASIYATSSVMSGLCTIIQTSFGVRLPIFQGPSIIFILPYINAASDPAWGCSTTTDVNRTGIYNGTESLIRKQPWLQEWNKVQGSLMAASALQILIGSLGLGGVLLRMMGPISITCLMLLMGISIQNLITTVAEVHWGMSCLNIALIVVLSMYINKITVPVPKWNRKNGFSFEPFHLFELFPVLLSVIIGWIIAFICTAAGAFTDNPADLGYQARTDFGLDAISEAPILSVPYPVLADPDGGMMTESDRDRLLSGAFLGTGQYGTPSFKVSYFVMMTMVVMASILESVGDYVQTTGPSRVMIPPPHAINRGIIIEGLGSILSGALGAGHATTSFSNMIGMIGITKVASRRVFNIAGLIMILLGVCGKLGALFVAIPKPVLAGPMFISVALLVGSALSNLRQVDLWSSRSQGVLGTAIMAGTVFPTWIQNHPDAINTGSVQFDQTITAFLGIPMVVGVIVAMFLDMTVPGNSRMKLQTMAMSKATDGMEDDSLHAVFNDPSVYDPPFLSKWTSKCSMGQYIPFLPSRRS